MKAVLIVLLVGTLSVSAMGATYFNSTANGSWDMYFAAEGYSDCGGISPVRMGGGGTTRANWGFTSFYDTSSNSQSLSQFVTANPTATATLYVCANDNIGANAYALETLRSGNTGGLVVDQDANGKSYQNPAIGITGASEPVAFRMAAPDNGTGYSQNGAGADVPWITPAGRNGSWNGTYSPTTGGQPILYDQGLLATGTPSGELLGIENYKKGLWALSDLLGAWTSNNSSHATKASVTTAGQYLNGGNDTPSLIGSANIVATDPQGNAAPAGYTWLAIPIDATLLNDMANNPESKALVFMNAISDAGNSIDSGWDQFLNDGTHAPYLAVTPEPMSLCLLALGGLGLLRRRR